MDIWPLMWNLRISSIMTYAVARWKIKNIEWVKPFVYEDIDKFNLFDFHSSLYQSYRRLLFRQINSSLSWKCFIYNSAKLEFMHNGLKALLRILPLLNSQDQDPNVPLLVIHARPLQVVHCPVHYTFIHTREHYCEHQTLMHAHRSYLNRNFQQCVIKHEYN